MSNAVYAALTRQQGLMQEMQVVANNLANASTTGYKSDRAIFAEFLAATGEDGGLSMGGLAGHSFELQQGTLSFTGGKFDVAIQGDGYFAVDTPQGARLTRAGHFQLSADGTLIDAFGHAVQGQGGGSITIPPEVTDLMIGADGSLSSGGEEYGRLNIVVPQGELVRDSNSYFNATEGFAESQESSVIQGALEQSNVSPVLEVARMIEVQRAYEAGQTILEREDERVGKLISSMRE